MPVFYLRFLCNSHHYLFGESKRHFSANIQRILGGPSSCLISEVGVAAQSSRSSNVSSYYFGRQSSSSSELHQEQEISLTPPTPDEIANIAKQIPIEKRSLIRGLSINEFEKDFIVYPEYTHAKEHERIKTFIQQLGGELEQAYEKLRLEVKVPRIASTVEGVLPLNVENILTKYNLFAVTVPKEFGGQNLCQKDLLQISECLGAQDLSLFQNFNNVALAANLIVQFGTQAQKEHYLPGIASGEWRVAVCLRDETSGTKPVEHIFAAKGQQQYLTAVKIDVENARDANMFIVFANRKIGDVVLPTCYLIERDMVVEPIASINVVGQIKTGGLKFCNFSTVMFENVPVHDWMILGSRDNSGYLTDELSVNGKTCYGAAVVGFLKKILGNLCNFANQQVKENLRIADSHPVQRSLTELGLLIYVVESVVFYLAGLTDEELFLIQDIENAIIQRLCNRAIRQAIMTITEVAGLTATNTELEYEQALRDAIALLSLSEPDLHLIRRVAISSIETYVNKFGGMKSFMDKLTVEKTLFEQPFEMEDFLNPKLVHFILEHVHPSLEPSARSLEYSMCRLGKLLDKVTVLQGIYVNTDYVSLENICIVMENLLTMTATIARASRSYAIGLRGADLEVDWTILYCTRAGEQTKNIILDTLNYQGLVKLSPRFTEVGKDLLQCNGYFPENPLEKNW